MKVHFHFWRFTGQPQFYKINFKILFNKKSLKWIRVTQRLHVLKLQFVERWWIYIRFKCSVFVDLPVPTFTHNETKHWTHIKQYKIIFLLRMFDHKNSCYWFILKLRKQVVKCNMINRLVLGCCVKIIIGVFFLELKCHIFIG